MTRMRGQLDWVLFITAIALACFGLVMVYSASSVIAVYRDRVQHPSHYFLLRQALAAGVGFLLLTAISQFDYRKLATAAWAFAGIGLSIVGLIAAIALDNQDRWIRVAGIQLQPSEFAKPALVIFLAWFVTKATDINSRHTLIPAGLALLFVGAGVGRGDLGTALVLVSTAAAVFFVARTHRKYLIMATVCMLCLFVAAILARPYRVNRIIQKFDPNYTFLVHFDPAHKLDHYAKSGTKVADPGYQGEQSRIAVGSGGVFGVGLMQGKQKLLYLPAVETDFIYAVVAEELGLFGSIAVIIAFVIVLWRGYLLYWAALDDFGRYLAVGATTSLVFQAFMNVSVALDMGPTKGIPLPLVSYGGSSLVSSMILFGLLLSVSGRTAAANGFE